MNQCNSKADAGTFLQRFAAVNLARCLRWHPRGLGEWSMSDWATAMQGEVGEVCEVLQDSWTAPLNRKNLADEIGDAFAYLDLFAQSCGLTITQCTSGMGVGAHRGTTWGAVALAAAAGKISDIVKKLNRVRDGLAGNKLTEAELRAELRDWIGFTAIRLMQLTDAAQLNFAEAVADKFNVVSERMALPERI